MKLRGTLGYAVLLYAAALLARECECAVTESPQEGNATSRIESAAVISEVDDDFVPYQGERFSVFDWMLFRTMGKKYRDNILISPVSIKMALVLLFEGAQDQTAYELSNVMQLPASRSATRDKFVNILKSLQAPSSAYTLNIGTRLYVDSDVLTRQRYEAIVKTFYNTDVVTANLSDSQPIVESVNTWVSNITEGGISKMIEDEDSIKDTVMLIMNAMFFKGSWQHKYFKPEDTRVGKFYVNSNESVDVPFMHAVGRFYYSESPELDAKILRIPYAGQKFAMYLILPSTRNGADHLMSDVNPFILTRHVWLMQDLPVDVYIPKFKIEFSSHLESTLRELGIRDIFDDTAMLTGIARTKRTSKHLQVSDILQKTGIEVNENGTIALAATEIQLGNKIEDETFQANHPFVFYIEDETTGTVLFIGKLANPMSTVGNTVGNTVDATTELPSRIGDEVTNTVSPAIFTTEERYNFFNVDLLQAVNEELDGNVVVSPASVKLALSILLEGTGGFTRQQLLSVLRLPDEQTKIRELAARTVAMLTRSENGTEIDSASSLWVQQAFPVNANYAKTLQRYYGGNVQQTDFTNAQVASSSINDWVRRVTRNKIQSLTDAGSVSPSTRMLLTSALYFKGRWLKAFDRKKTSLKCFNVPNKGCQETHFMESTSKYRYAYIPALDADVVEIPYSDRKSAMLILLPKKENDHNLRILSKDLSYVPISSLLASLAETEVQLSLPKFTIERKPDLRPALTRVGIDDIFAATANLSGIAQDDSLRVSSITQSAKIEVDEDGTIAAAVTTFVITPLIASSVEVFTANRPFVFMIVDLETGGTLFSGRFLQPNEPGATR